jgi:hypothetical protein
MVLLKRLGVPDFLESGKSFWAQMKRVYDGVATQALDVAFADTEQGDVSKI